MRVAVVETSNFGGLLHYASQLADGLAERGHEVDLIVARDNELAHRASRARMRAVLTPHVRQNDAPPRNPVLYQARRVLIASRLARAYARVLREVRVQRYDAVILQWDVWWLGGQLAQRALARGRARPFISLIVHNVLPFNRWGGENLFLAPERTLAATSRAARGLDLAFVHGEQSRIEFKNSWPPIPVAVIPHGDENLFAGEPPDPSPAPEERILFFGDWRKVKGMTVLMDAFDELAARRPTVRLTIAGTPSPADLDDEIVRRWAATHDSRVTLIGRYVPIEEVPAIFATARVVTTPYVAGFQSGVLHLAQTMGCAVVTSDVGDLPAAIVEGETGLVVPAGDPHALADALERVVTDVALATRMGEAARRHVQQRASWNVVAAAVVAAIEAGIAARDQRSDNDRS